MCYDCLLYLGLDIKSWPHFILLQYLSKKREYMHYYDLKEFNFVLLFYVYMVILTFTK